MEAVSWLGVAMAAISMVGNVAMTISNNRTKAKIAENELKYAKELSDIRNELGDCRADRADLRTRLAAAEARAADADKAAQAIRLELASIRGRLLAEESRRKQG